MTWMLDNPQKVAVIGLIIVFTMLVLVGAYMNRRGW